MESALTTSPSSASASSTPSADLPVAVGPTTATTSGTGLSKHGLALYVVRPAPGHDVVTDAVRRLVPGVTDQRRTCLCSGPGQHLPGGAARNKKIARERRIELQQCRRVATAQC